MEKWHVSCSLRAKNGWTAIIQKVENESNEVCHLNNNILGQNVKCAVALITCILIRFYKKEKG